MKRCIRCNQLKKKEKVCSIALSREYCIHFGLLQPGDLNDIKSGIAGLCHECLRYLAVRENKKNHFQRPKYKLSRNIRQGIYKSLRTGKGGKWERFVGYTIGDLKQHLEKQFQPGMTWDNYGKWHIDHIRPIALFHFSTPEDKDFKRCWALSNLQALWATDNCANGKLDMDKARWLDCNIDPPEVCWQ